MGFALLVALLIGMTVANDADLGCVSWVRVQIACKGANLRAQLAHTAQTRARGPVHLPCNRAEPQSGS